MTSYKIAREKTLDDLIADVKCAIEEGWRVVGGVTIEYSNRGEVQNYLQVVVK